MSRRCTTAWSRARRTRRRVHTLLLTGAAAALVVVGPSLMASASETFERHLIAEAAGDTAQNVAVKAGRVIVADAEVPATLTVREAANGSCLIREIQMPVECGTVVKIKHMSDGSFRVIAHRHGERFVFDSKYAV